MELREKIENIFRDSWESPEIYADLILALPEMQKLALFPELVGALEGAIKQVHSSICDQPEHLSWVDLITKAKELEV
mgnify:CR=1 FL=1